jgi:hypothetical protein
MILFPPVPYIYTPPVLTLSELNNNPIAEVGLTFSRLYTLTFTKNDAGTASSYTFLQQSIAFSFSSTQSLTTTASQIYYTSTPTNYTIQGTMSHQAGPILNDSYGNPSPNSIPANNNLSSNTLTQRTIFPYFYGRVYKSVGVPGSLGPGETGFTFSDIFSPTNPATSSRVSLLLSNSQNIPFNTGGPGITTGDYKGFLAVPKTSGSQTEVVYDQYVEPGNELNSGIIPDSGGLFSLFTLNGVNINGILQNYSIYLFNYGSSVSTLTLSI